jgi:hypothetical protein
MLSLCTGLAISCGGSSEVAGFVPENSSSGNIGSGGSSGISFGDGGTSSDGGKECPPSATQVYVTGEGSKLYSFNPPDQKFTLVGTFDCLTNPTHMTVDRLGNAWVVADGQLYKASTTDAHCSPVGNWNFDFNYSDFSLSFVGLQDTDSTLYVLNGSSKLSAFDTGTGKLTSIGTVGVPATLGDMTSNGDGTLYFLLDVQKPTLYQFDTSNGATRSSAALNATGGGTQALAFWGGRFYAFENDAIYEPSPSARRHSASPAPVSQPACPRFRPRQSDARHDQRHRWS